MKCCKQHLSVDQPVVLTWKEINSCCKVLRDLFAVRNPLILSSLVSGSVRPLISMVKLRNRDMAL